MILLVHHHLVINSSIHVSRECQQVYFSQRILSVKDRFHPFYRPQPPGQKQEAQAAPEESESVRWQSGLFQVEFGTFFDRRGI